MAPSLKWIVFAAVVLHAAPASACSRARCGVPEVRTLPSRDVPIDELYFEVLVATPRELVLRDLTTGAAIPASIRMLGPDRVFAPDVALTPGHQVELSYFDDCDKVGSSQYTLLPVPARSGESALTAVAQGLRETESDKPTEFSFIDFEYELHGLPTNQTELQVEVDGQPYDPLYTSEIPQPFTILAYCDGSFAFDSCGGTGSWSIGRHTVRVLRRVIGVGTETTSVEIDLRCDKGGRVVDGSELVANPELRTEGVGEDGCQLGGTQGIGALSALLAILFRRRSRA